MHPLLRQVLKTLPLKSNLEISVRGAAKSKVFIPVQKTTEVPELFYSLEERLKEKDAKLKDPDLYKKVDIGLPSRALRRVNVVEQKKVLTSLKNDMELEKKARNCTFVIDMDEVEKEWISSTKPQHVKILAENYQIFDHLFGNFAYFYPVIHLNITYDYDESTVSPVWFGNLLKPAETVKVPTIQFSSKEDELWTLILTNPDGNLYENDAEMIHWFVGNIPGGKIEAGEEIYDYLLPIPPKGTGFHRYVFVLYKQNEKIDFSKFKKEKPCLRLKDRTFKTLDFYKEHEDKITPAGLSWFQADWDASLKNVFHNILRMKEPIYEYVFPKQYIRPPRHFPWRKPFNRYMDLHRDPKEMQKLMLLKRLANVHPFEGDTPRHPFPQAIKLDGSLPIWLKNEIRYERDGSGKYRDVYRGDDRPYQFTGKRTPFVKFRPSSTITEEEKAKNTPKD